MTYFESGSSLESTFAQCVNGKAYANDVHTLARIINQFPVRSISVMRSLPDRKLESIFLSDIHYAEGLDAKTTDLPGYRVAVDGF